MPKISRERDQPLEERGCKTAPFALLPPDPTARARFFAELAPSYALEWLICASRIPLAPGGSRAPIGSERVDSGRANQVSHAPWQITLDKLAWENRGPLPVTAEVPLGEGSEQMVAGVEREAPMRITCGPTGRPLLPVRMEVADAAVNEIMATTFRVPVKRLILVKGTDYQDELEEISYRIRELDPDVMSDEQYDASCQAARRTGPAQGPARRAGPVGRAAHRGAVRRHLPGSPRLAERGAWLTSHGFVIHATKKEVSVIQGDVRGTAHLG